MKLEDLKVGSVVTITYKAKDGKEYMQETCDRQVRAIKILAICGLLIGVSKYNDLNRFDKWCTISELQYDLDYWSKPCSYSELYKIFIN